MSVPPATTPITSPHPPIVAERLTRRFGGVVALADVSFSIAEGQILGILGPNGAGKSTLINVVSGLVPASEGSVRIGGEPVDGLGMPARARLGLLRSFQNTRPSDELTAAELLRSAEAAPRHAAGGSRWSGERLMALFGLSAYADEKLAALPYGVQKMLGLAAVALCRPRVLFLDEPFQGVTEADIGRLCDVIRHFLSEGVAIGLVEHNVPSVLALCAEVMVLDSGRTIYHGEAQGALHDPAVRTAYLGQHFRAKAA